YQITIVLCGQELREHTINTETDLYANSHTHKNTHTTHTHSHTHTHNHTPTQNTHTSPPTHTVFLILCLFSGQCESRQTLIAGESELSSPHTSLSSSIQQHSVRFTLPHCN